MQFGKIALVAGASLLCAACGGIKVEKVLPASSGATRVGVPYNLGMTRYEITIKYSVTQCLDKSGSPRLKIAVDTDAPAVIKAVDPAHMYLLHSDGDFETSDIKAEFDATGVSTSLNATAADRTPQIIANAVGTIAQVAAFAAAAGAPAVGAKSYGACNQRVGEALDAMTADKDAVKALGDKLDAATAEVNKWTTVAAKALILDGATRASLLQALIDQDTAQKGLDAAKKKLQKDIDATTYKFTVRWPQNGDLFSGVCDAALDQACAMSVLGANTPLFNLASAMPGGLTQAQWDELSLVHFRIAPAVLDDPLARTDGTNDDADIAKGIPARFATNGRFRAFTCFAQKPSAAGDDKPDDNKPRANASDIADLTKICTALPHDPGLDVSVGVIADVTNPVLQLGRTYTVPLPSGAFHSGTIAIATGDGGVLKSVQSKVDAAALETAGGVLKDTTTSAASIYNTIHDADLTRLKKETDDLTLQKNYLTAKQALSPTALQTMQSQAEAAMYTADTQVITAKAAALAAGAVLDH